MIAPMVAIGVGCRRNTPAAAIESVVRQALAQAADVVVVDQARQGGEGPPPLPVMVGAGRPPLHVMVGAGRPSGPFSPQPDRPALFTIEDKANEPGLIEAARSLNLTLTFLSRATLRVRRIHTRSPRALAEFGVPSVAEAAALAGAGPGANLVLPRITAHGVTCAIARQGVADLTAATP